MKRSIDETDNANANDARQKLKDSLVPFDQSREASEALLLQCCYSILERQPSRSLNVRGQGLAPGAAAPEHLLDVRARRALLAPLRERARRDRPIQFVH